MITTMEMRDGRLTVPAAILDGFELKDGDLVELAMLRAFRRGGKVVDLEPEGKSRGAGVQPVSTDEWQDLS